MNAPSPKKQALIEMITVATTCCGVVLLDHDVRVILLLLAAVVCGVLAQIAMRRVRLASTWWTWVKALVLTPVICPFVIAAVFREHWSGAFLAVVCGWGLGAAAFKWARPPYAA
jgi:hypothetical protein